MVFVLDAIRAFELVRDIRRCEICLIRRLFFRVDDSIVPFIGYILFLHWYSLPRWNAYAAWFKSLFQLTFSLVTADTPPPGRALPAMLAFSETVCPRA